MFFSFRELVLHYADALVKKAGASRRAAHDADISVCLQIFFPKNNDISIESFSRGILTLRAEHASARFAVETKKENLLLCFKKHGIPVKKIICKM